MRMPFSGTMDTRTGSPSFQPRALMISRGMVTVDDAPLRLIFLSNLIGDDMVKSLSNSTLGIHKYFYTELIKISSIRVLLKRGLKE